MSILKPRLMAAHFGSVQGGSQEKLCTGCGRNGALRRQLGAMCAAHAASGFRSERSFTRDLVSLKGTIRARQRFGHGSPAYLSISSPENLHALPAGRKMDTMRFSMCGQYCSLYSSGEIFCTVIVPSSARDGGASAR